MGCGQDSGCSNGSVGGVILPKLPTHGQTDETTAQGQWNHRTVVEASLVTNQPQHIHNEYQKLITLTGVETESGGGVEYYDLKLDYPFELRRVNLHFVNSFQKTISVDVYGFNASANTNCTLISASNHFNQDYESVENRTFLYPRLIRFSIDNLVSNNGQKVEITVSTRVLNIYTGQTKFDLMKTQKDMNLV